MEYVSSVSYSKFPDASTIEILRHFLGKSETSSYMRENYALLQIGFTRLAYERLEDISSYGTESLFGEFGGNMGLFLGCSLLTLCEFLDFFWETLVFRIRKRTFQVNVDMKDTNGSQ